MNTTAYIKHEFIVQTLEWGLSRLREVQLRQLTAMRQQIEQRHFNYADLYSGVATRSTGIVGSDGRYRIVVPVDKRLRYADMKRFSNGAKGPNARVYNRPTWGVLLGRDDSVRTRLRQGIGEALQQQLTDRLQQALTNRSE